MLCPNLEQATGIEPAYLQFGRLTCYHLHLACNLNLILGSFFGKCRNPKQHYRTHPNIATSVSYSDPFPMLIFLPTHGFYISNVATLFALSGIIRLYMSFGDPYMEIGDAMYFNIKF